MNPQIMTPALMIEPSSWLHYKLKPVSLQGVTVGSKEWHSLISIHLSPQKIATY